MVIQSELKQRMRAFPLVTIILQIINKLHEFIYWIIGFYRAVLFDIYIIEQGECAVGKI